MQGLFNNLSPLKDVSPCLTVKHWSHTDKKSNARWQLELASCDLRSLLSFVLPDLLTQAVLDNSSNTSSSKRSIINLTVAIAATMTFTVAVFKALAITIAVTPALSQVVAKHTHA